MAHRSVEAYEKGFADGLSMAEKCNGTECLLEIC